jgi:hypothetical protein
MLGAEGPQQASATPAELGLQAAGMVVQPGMDDPAVVPALVPGKPVLLLKDGNGGGWPSKRQGTSDSQAYDPASDDRDAVRCHPASHPPSTLITWPVM